MFGDFEFKGNRDEPLVDDFFKFKDNRELKHQKFLRSRTSTGSHWSNYVCAAHVMTFASSR